MARLGSVAAILDYLDALIAAERHVLASYRARVDFEPIAAQMGRTIDRLAILESVWEGIAGEDYPAAGSQPSGPGWRGGDGG